MWVAVFDPVHGLRKSKWPLPFFRGGPNIFFEVQVGFHWCPRKVKQISENRHL